MASVTYKIGGKYDGKGVTQAQKGLQSLQKAAKAFNTAVGGFVVGKVFEGINKVVNLSTESFKKQNSALTKYNTAVKSAGLSLEKMNKIEAQIKNTSIFDDDAIRDAMSLGTQMGLTEEQMEKVMKAAAGMASAGVMPLDQAVKSLSQSYSGNITQLKKMNPELADLTEEQLKNGDAVDSLVSKYSDYSEIMKGTFEGRQTDFNNNVSDLEAAAGSIKSALQFTSQGKLNELLPKITTWIEENRQKILNVFYQMPDLWKTVSNAIKQTFEKFFSVDGLTKFFKVLSSLIWKLIGTTKQNAEKLFTVISDYFFDLLSNIATNFGKYLSQEMGWAGEDFAEEIKGVLNFIQNSMNAIHEFITNPLGYFRDLGEMILHGTTPGYIQSVDQREAARNNRANSGATMGTITEVTRTWSRTVADAFREAGIGLSEDYADIWNNATEDMKKILLRELPEDVKNALAASGGVWNDSVTKTATKKDERSNWYKDLIKWLKDSSDKYLKPVFKPFEDLMSKFKDSNFSRGFIDLFNSSSVQKGLSFIQDFLSQLVSSFANKSDSLNKLMSWMSTITDYIADELFPWVDEILRPMIELLEWATPAIEAVVITILNVIVAIENAFISMYNGIVNVANFFGAKLKKQSLVSFKGYDSIGTADYSSSSDTSSSSASASYSAAQDVYVTINYNQSYVNGDAQAIAINLAQEIRQAEKMNLIG